MLCERHHTSLSTTTGSVEHSTAQRTPTEGQKGLNVNYSKQLLLKDHGTKLVTKEWKVWSSQLRRDSSNCDVTQRELNP